MIWDLINSFGRLVLTMIVIYKVTQFRETMNMTERAGLSMMGGGSFLTIALIWDTEGPFQGWAVTILTYGAVMFLCGRTWRDRQHMVANRKMANMAGQWKHDRSRG